MNKSRQFWHFHYRLKINIIYIIGNRLKRYPRGQICTLLGPHNFLFNEINQKV